MPFLEGWQFHDDGVMRCHEERLSERLQNACKATFGVAGNAGNPCPQQETKNLLKKCPEIHIEEQNRNAADASRLAGSFRDRSFGEGSKRRVTLLIAAKVEAELGRVLGPVGVDDLLVDREVAVGVTRR